MRRTYHTRGAPTKADFVEIGDAHVSRCAVGGHTSVVAEAKSRSVTQNLILSNPVTLYDPSANTLRTCVNRQRTRLLLRVKKLTWTAERPVLTLRFTSVRVTSPPRPPKHVNVVAVNVVQSLGHLHSKAAVKLASAI